MALTKVTYSLINGAVANVLDYGAVGDGVTDDRAAIQSAVNSFIFRQVPRVLLGHDPSITPQVLPGYVYQLNGQITGMGYADGALNVTAPNGIYNGRSAIRTGLGSPEGVITAPVGSLYTRTNGGAGTTLYVKESNSSSVGWVAK